MMRASIIRLSPLLLLAAALIALTFLFTPDAPPAQAQAAVTPGSLDTTFGTDGKVTTNFSADDSGNAVALQPDGKIVVAGYTNTNFAVARYNADGTLDTTFDSDGKVTTAIGSGTDKGYALGLQPDGKIVVAGESHNGTDKDFALARYNANGTLDNTFGTVDSGQTRLGYATTTIGSADDVAYGLALQPDGKIVLAGQSNNGSNLDFALARYNANGTLDTSFGTGGKVTTAFGNGIDSISAVALQPDGKIVVAGYTNTDFALARYNANGSLDTSFSNDGKVTTDLGTAFDAVYAVALQPDGKIVAAGEILTAFGLARYNADGSLDTTFGEDGKVTTYPSTRERRHKRLSIATRWQDRSRWVHQNRPRQRLRPGTLQRQRYTGHHLRHGRHRHHRLFQRLPSSEGHHAATRREDTGDRRSSRSHRFPFSRWPATTTPLPRRRPRTRPPWSATTGRPPALPTEPTIASTPRPSPLAAAPTAT